MANLNSSEPNTGVFWKRIEYVRTLTNVSALQKAILYALVTRMGKKDACFPRIALLCVDCGGKERAVQLALKSLEHASILNIRWRLGPNGTNLYSIVLPVEPSAVPQLPGEPSNVPVPQIEDSRRQQIAALGALAAPPPVKSAGSEAQQVRPKEHGIENVNENTCHHVDIDFDFSAPPAKTHQMKFLWKDLCNSELAEIVRNTDVKRWKTFDDEWMKAFGSKKSSQRRQLRLAMWRSAYRKATETDGSMAALLVSAFRKYGDGKAAETYCNCDDAEWARAALNPPRPLPSRTANSVPIRSPFQQVSDLASDYP